MMTLRMPAVTVPWRLEIGRDSKVSFRVQDGLDFAHSLQRAAAGMADKNDCASTRGVPELRAMAGEPFVPADGRQFSGFMLRRSKRNQAGHRACGRTNVHHGADSTGGGKLDILPEEQSRAYSQVRRPSRSVETCEPGRSPCRFLQCRNAARRKGCGGSSPVLRDGVEAIGGRGGFIGKIVAFGPRRNRSFSKALFQSQNLRPRVVDRLVHPRASRKYQSMAMARHAINWQSGRPGFCSRNRSGYLASRDRRYYANATFRDSAAKIRTLVRKFCGLHPNNSIVVPGSTNSRDEIIRETATPGMRAKRVEQQFRAERIRPQAGILRVDLAARELESE